ncbi:MAG: protease inhibitor I42 family protein [Synechococcaceae cyanobacterium]
MTHAFDSANNGSRVDIQVGEDFSVVLEESPGTGYRWILEGDLSQPIELVGSDFTVAGTGIGGGGERRLRFRASHPGAFSITLRQAREWEPAGSAINTFILTGVVS